jgi:Zn-finger nucleic acid-binding protein
MRRETMPDKKMLAGPIDCPRCFVTCARQTRAGVEIDICSKCAGIWLDKKELLRLIHNKSMYETLTRYAQVESKSKLVCPRCGGLMDLEKANEIIVDVCITCKGIWLDAGEFEGLAAKEGEAFKGYDPEKERKLEKIQARNRQDFLTQVVGLFRGKRPPSGGAP